MRADRPYPLRRGTERPIRVLLADDHAIVRSGIAAIVDSVPYMRVVAQADNGYDVPALVASSAPDVCLLDIRMPGPSGPELIPDIVREHPDTRCVIVTNYDTEAEIDISLRAGAHGYILKDATSDELIECIGVVHDGQPWFTSRVLEQLSQRYWRLALTPREREVLTLLADGLSNRQIATRLGIAEGTVKLHMSHLLDKLGVTNRTEALTVALRRGLLPSR